MSVYDFQIGNYVFLAGSLDKRASSSNATLAMISGINLQEVAIVHFTSSIYEEPIVVNKSQIQYVRLDTNWLDDFGLLEEKAGHYLVKGVSADIQLDVESDGVYLFFTDGPSRMKIKKINWVHQLQNLTKSFTEKRLFLDYSL
jgi:hypothetical protein